MNCKELYNKAIELMENGKNIDAKEAAKKMSDNIKQQMEEGRLVYDPVAVMQEMREGGYE